MPRPSSLTVITTLLPRCEARSETVPARGLPARLALVGRLEPVVDRVADHVDQGVGELVDHPLVELGLLAADLEDRPPCPRRWLRSRMTRRNRSNSGPIGTIRVSSTPFCRPSETRPRLWIASESA